MEMRKRQRIVQVVLITFGMLAVIVMWGSDVIRMLDFKIPDEIREGANAALADAFAHGNNPYRSLRTPEGMPNVYNMYPALNNLIAALIVKITAIPAGLVLLLLNFIYTTLTSAMIGKITYYYVKNPCLIVLAFLMTHYCGWRYTNVSAFPDMLAVLLMVTIMYLCTVKTGRIGYKEVVCLSILTVLGFYSKQYAIVIGIPAVIYLWIKESRQKSLIYIGICAALGIASAGIIYLTMPLYFAETLLLVGNSADNDFHWAITQFIKIGKLFFPWFLILLLWIGFKWIKRRELDFVVINFLSMAVVLLYFGQNTGAHLSYHLQLWLPSVIILSMRALDWLIKLIQEKWQKHNLIVIVEVMALFFAIYPYYWFHTPLLSQEQKTNWAKVYEIADNSENLLATSQNANYEVWKNRYMYDYGQNQYILRNEAQEFWSDIENSDFIMAVFPNVTDLKELHEEYRQEILHQLENAEYDTLILVDNFGFTRDWEEFQVIRDENYNLIEEVPLETSVWKWQVGIWEPKID